MRFMVIILIALFPVSEIGLALLKRSQSKDAHDEDRGSMRLLWINIAIGISLAIMLARISSAYLPVSIGIARLIALGFYLGGLALRWAAIFTLGRFFTVDVAIHKDHVVYQEGLYRYMRHPSYTGLLIAFLGMGIYFYNWLSILGLMIPITFAVINRVNKEEKALLNALGEKYAEYCNRTKRFIPGLL